MDPVYFVSPCYIARRVGKIYWGMLILMIPMFFQGFIQTMATPVDGSVNINNLIIDSVKLLCVSGMDNCCLNNQRLS